MRIGRAFDLFTACALFVACSNVGDVYLDERIVYQDGTVTENRITLKKSGGCYEYHRDKAEFENVDSLIITPSFAHANAGDEGFFMNPRGYVTYFLEGRDNAVYKLPRKNQITMTGIKTPSGCYASIFDGYRFDVVTQTKVKGGKYTNSFIVPVKNTLPYSDFTVKYYPLKGKNATYSGMGRLYRRLKVKESGMEPLAERVKTRPELKYALENPEIRIRQAWKPVPATVKHQTLENEPPVRVKVPFDRVCDIIDALKNEGVEGAQITLVGWNISGHDGRYPTVFPPEPALGGEERLKHLISYAQEQGFQIVPHICTGDAYEISPDFSWEDIVKTKKGKPYTYFVYGGGQMYELCYEVAHKKFAVPIVDSLKRMGFRGVMYNDVYSIDAPHQCFDPNHPCYGDDAAEYARLTLEKCSELGGVASEGGYDHVIPTLDFALYVCMSYKDKLTTVGQFPLIDDYYPIWHVIYNGYIYSCPFSNSVNYPVKSPQMAMKIQEYGGHPTFYYYAGHRDDENNWIGRPGQDLYCETQEELEASAKAIKVGYDYMKEYGYLQYLFIDDHCSIADKVYKTTYSDGTVTICNYLDMPFEYKGTSVPAEDWKVIKKK